MRLSFETFCYLLSMHDREAHRVQDLMHDMEWSASKHCEGRVYFSVTTELGELNLETHHKPYKGW